MDDALSSSQTDASASAGEALSAVIHWWQSILSSSLHSNKIVIGISVKDFRSSSPALTVPLLITRDKVNTAAETTQNQQF